MVQDDVFFLHEYEVIDSLSFSAKRACCKIGQNNKTRG